MVLNLSKKIICRKLLLILSFLFIVHFLISLKTWIHAEIWIMPRFRPEDKNINWRAMRGAIPCVLLFFSSIVVFLMIYKKKRWAPLFLLLLFLASATCFYVDTKYHLYQMETPAYHIGSRYSLVSIGWRYHYWTWWWYKETQLDESFFESEHKQ